MTRHTQLNFEIHLRMPSYGQFGKIELLSIQEKEISYYLLAGIVSVSQKSQRK